MKITVKQGFETLGDPCRTTHRSQRAADAAANKLAIQIANFIIENADPDEDEDETSLNRHLGGGSTREEEFWDRWPAREFLTPGNREALAADVRQSAIEIDVDN